MAKELEQEIFTARFYEVYYWDCPECGEVMERYSNEGGEDKCEGCGVKVYVD